jgi:hypothetical protein
MAAMAFREKKRRRAFQEECLSVSSGALHPEPETGKADWALPKAGFTIVCFLNGKEPAFGWGRG